jgi:hypothetical protein
MINSMLPKMGYSSKTTRDVVFGLRTYLGISLRHLGPERGVQQSLLLLKHLRTNHKLSCSCASVSLGFNYKQA